MAKNEKKESANPKGAVPMWAWGLLGLALLAFLIQRFIAFEHRRPESAEEETENLLTKRGTLLVLGDLDLKEFTVKGTKPITLEGAADLKNLLEGDNEDAFVQALEKKGIQSLVAATSLADPATLPKVSIQTRLSLFKPMERLRAVYLCPRFGLYEIAEAETLSDEAGKALVALARKVLVGQTPPDKGALLPEVTGKRRREVSVMIQGLTPIANKNASSTTWHQLRRDLFESRQGRSLYDATVQAAKAVRDRFKKEHEKREGAIEEAMKRLTIEVEVFERPERVQSLQGALSPKDYDLYLWRAIELGVHGLVGKTGDKSVFLLPSSAIYWDRETVANFLDRIGKNLYGESGKDRARYRTDKGLSLFRFRTFHFREMTPEGAVARLSRGIPPVTPEDLTRKRFEESVRWASHWLVDNINPVTHEFVYKYFPSKDIELTEMSSDEDAYNAVRHALAVYGLFMAYSALKEPWILEGAENAMKFITDRFVFGPAWFSNSAKGKLPPDAKKLDFGIPGPGGRIDKSAVWKAPDGRDLPIPQDMGFLFHDNTAKMGGSAGVALLVSEMILVQPERKDELLALYRPYLEAVGRFLLFMQRPDGAFFHYFVASDHPMYKTTTTIYPGEVMFGLARLYRMLGDERYAEAFKKAHDYYKAWFEGEEKKVEPNGTYAERLRLDLVQFVPWISMAENEMHALKPDPDYADFGVHVSDWIVDHYQFNDGRTYYPEYLGGYYKIATEMPAMHGCVYTEGTAAAYDLARRAGLAPLASKMARSTILGCRFAVQQIFVPGRNMHFIPNPDRAKGGARYAINRSKLRIDYSYHSLSALVQALRYFDPTQLKD